MTDKAVPYPPAVLKGEKSQRVFRGSDLLQIAMPLGGIGAGCICLNGQGGLQDFSIRNTPATTAVPDGHQPADSAFALLYFPDQHLTRLVEGPMPPERIYDQGLKTQGYRVGGHEGLPRFRKASFQGEYPFGYVRLSDPALPLQVTITGFNPFIPLDDKASGIPCAILEYALENCSDRPVPFQFSYHLSHLAPGKDLANSPKSRNLAIPGLGVYLHNLEDANDATFGSAALGVIDHEPLIKAMWFRGGWFDAISALWREVSTGSFTPNDGALSATGKGRNGCSLLLNGSLDPGQKVTYPVVITWYFPNAHYAYGGIEKEGELTVHQFAEHGGSEPGCECDDPGCCQSVPPRWRPYYVSQWKDAREVLLYLRDHYPALRSRTQAFHDALFSSSLPSYVLDAISANLAILKSPTVLRQENGNIWAWEGCFSNSGCCHGSCTHVWNYAQSLAHLFPSLERTLREQELIRSMDERGHVTFRSALPDGPTPHDFHAAADGQLGGIMKVYREWQVCGHKDWLLKMYPFVKKSMDFCIENWDPRHAGLVEEPHHNTYDIEFWGPDGMCTSFYLGALTALATMARAVSHQEDAVFYEDLAARGARAMDQELFNGEYYEQKVKVEGLRAAPSPEILNRLAQENPEEARLYQEEGPKYQYGQGCLSDSVLGAWLADMCGLHSPQTPQNIQRNLQAIFEYNFRTSLWEHANLQRPGYAIGDEPGLLLCTWPQGGKPTLPFVYSDEVWTGIEYQVASHLVSKGMVAEGLTIVRAARQRYDGHKRNPWNEYECGSYYARAMASFALLLALSGFRYSAPEQTLYLHPRINEHHFKTFFSTATGWGTLLVSDRQVIIQLSEGTLAIDRLILTRAGQVITLQPHVVAQAGKQVVIHL